MLSLFKQLSHSTGYELSSLCHVCVFRAKVEKKKNIAARCGDKERERKGKINTAKGDGIYKYRPVVLKVALRTNNGSLTKMVNLVKFKMIENCLFTKNKQLNNVI